MAGGSFSAFRLPGCFRVSPRLQDVIDDFADTFAVLDPREQEGASAAHFRAVAFHDGEVGLDRLGQVGLVDDQQVRLGNSGATFSGDLVSAGDIDDIANAAL